MRARLPPLLLLAALLACGKPLPFAPASSTAAPAPSKPGPFKVGVRTQLIEDSSRKKADGGARQLWTEVWYPADPDTRGPGASYDLTAAFTDDQRGQMADAGVVLPLLETSAVRDASPDSEHGPYPLVVFSHGQGAFRWQSTFYTVALASHGYVVASVDHEGGTLSDVVRNALQSTLVGIDDRPRDVRLVIHRFEKLAQGDALEGLIDFEHIGVTGHSFGALTSLRVAALDEKVKAIVPQSPTNTDIAWLGLSPRPQLAIPVQIQAAGRDKTLKFEEHALPAWSSLSRPRWLLNLTQGGHMTFSDLCSFDLQRVVTNVTLEIPGVGNVGEALNDGCAPPAPPADQAQPLMNHFAIGFFNGHLRGSPKSLELLTQEGADQLSAGTAQVTAEP